LNLDDLPHALQPNAWRIFLVNPWATRWDFKRAMNDALVHRLALKLSPKES
jgi:hypothetical protein